MILNSYAVLDGFISILRFALGALVVLMGVMAWRQWSPELSPEKKKSLEDRYYLLFLQAFLLLGLNLFSWPIFYLLLESYVPEWPGAMCVFGVTRVGAGTVGSSRFLPVLVKVLEVTKPAVIFLAGAWFVLYLATRRTATYPLMRRVLGAAVALGLLVGLDSAAEAAYLVIPKTEKFLSAGCCTAVYNASSRPSKLPESLLGLPYRSLLYGGYYWVNIGMAALLAGYTFLPKVRPGKKWLVPLLAGAVISMIISGLFLVEIAAPTILQLPYHHCPYDLISEAPDSLVAAGLFVLGCFSIGWAVVVYGLAKCGETEPFLAEFIRKLMSIALVCYLGSVVMMTLELQLA